MDNSTNSFEEKIDNINHLGLTVLRNVHHFPVYDKDIVSPYLVVCINHSGTARVLYDMQEAVFKQNEVAVVLPDHILRPLETSPDYCVTLIVHSPAFIEELNIKRLSQDRYKFHQLPACSLTDEEMTQYLKAVELVEDISNASVERYPLRHEMLIAQANVMIEMINAFRQEMDTQTRMGDYKYSIFNDFCDLLALHYRKEHEVGFYAESMHLTPRYFSMIVKEVIGRSASDYIEEYIATQAKNILQTRPDLSVQQICFHLGFASSPSFCRFFKRVTGKTPKQYRRK